MPTVPSAWVLSLLVATAPAATPTASGAPYEGKPRVRATLVSDVTQVEPGGTFRRGVRLEMARGWHVSWKNAREVGLPTEVQCIPARLELTRVLGVGRTVDPAGAALLDAAAAHVPRPADAAGLRVSVRRTTPFVPGQPFGAS